MSGSTIESRERSFEWVGALEAEAIGELRALFNAVLATDDVIGFPAPLREDEGEAFFAGMALDVRLGRKQMLLARDGGALAAMVLLAPNGQPNCRHLAEVSKCMVHPEHRRTGMIGWGLRHVRTRCRELGIEILTLDVRKGSPAERLWLHLGFQPFGELSDYARVGGRSEAGVFMWGEVERLGTLEATR
jgi:GNAT superfamily N-acetyltransferase